MEKYLFKYWRTYPFKKKTFEGQMERYAKVCVVSVDNPQRVLDIIPIYGKETSSGLRDIINMFYDLERGITIDNSYRGLIKSLQEPIVGQFEEIKSMHGPLFRQFTPDEAKYGLCSEHDVWKPERDINDKVIEYNSMRVFTMSLYDPDFGKYNYVDGWFPFQMYYKYFGYRYFPISQLRGSL